MANHLTPDEVAKEFGIDTGMSFVSASKSTSQSIGKIDKTLAAARDELDRELLPRVKARSSTKLRRAPPRGARSASWTWGGSRWSTGGGRLADGLATGERGSWSACWRSCNCTKRACIWPRNRASARRTRCNYGTPRADVVAPHPRRDAGRPQRRGNAGGRASDRMQARPHPYSRPSPRSPAACRREQTRRRYRLVGQLHGTLRAIGPPPSPALATLRRRDRRTVTADELLACSRIGAVAACAAARWRSWHDVGRGRSRCSTACAPRESAGGAIGFTGRLRPERLCAELGAIAGGYPLARAGGRPRGRRCVGGRGARDRARGRDRRHGAAGDRARPVGARGIAWAASHQAVAQPVPLPGAVGITHRRSRAGAGRLHALARRAGRGRDRRRRGVRRRGRRRAPPRARPHGRRGGGGDGGGCRARSPPRRGTARPRRARCAGSGGGRSARGCGWSSSTGCRRRRRSRCSRASAWRWRRRAERAAVVR